jgi:processive 1,2-diacylglycerol beta-glucosyltransferase
LNILFITSNSTGQGHKSITEAVSAQIKRLSPDASILVQDGFVVGNFIAKVSGRVYNTIAVYFPFLWELIYRFCDSHYRFINKLTVSSTEKGITDVIETSKPDIIISVHAAFVGSIITILENHHYSIPLVSIIADLDNVSALWSDKRAKAIICPTQEAKRKMIRSGMAPEKLYIFGFPLRERFTAVRGFAENPMIEGLGYESDKPLALLISGSQGSRRSARIVKTLLRADCCNICVVTGSNKILRKELEIRYAADLGKRLNVIGFTKELDAYMLAADFLIARASPNVLMEAVCLGKPLITTDAFPGQEKKNPEFIRNHHLGVHCKKIEFLPDIIRRLTADNCAGLKEISKNQSAFYKPDCAERIAKFVIQRANKS